MKSMKKGNRHSFTLIEIMIVVVIIGMLAALVGPNVLGNMDKAKVSRFSSMASVLPTVPPWGNLFGNSKNPYKSEIERQRP